MLFCLHVYSVRCAYVFCVCFVCWAYIITLPVLTLNMLNCFKDHERCIHISYLISDFVQQTKWKNPTHCPFYTVNTMPADALGTPGFGDSRSHSISRHDIDLQSWDIPSPASEELLGIIFPCFFSATSLAWDNHVVASVPVKWPWNMCVKCSSTLA